MRKVIKIVQINLQRDEPSYFTVFDTFCHFVRVFSLLTKTSFKCSKHLVLSFLVMLVNFTLTTMACTDFVCGLKQALASISRSAL